MNGEELDKKKAVWKVISLYLGLAHTSVHFLKIKQAVQL